MLQDNLWLDCVIYVVLFCEFNCKNWNSKKQNKHKGIQFIMMLPDIKEGADTSSAYISSERDTSQCKVSVDLDMVSNLACYLFGTA